MNIQDIRNKFPQYDDLSDQELSNKLYEKFYSDMDQEQFEQRFLGDAISTITGEPVPTDEESIAQSQKVLGAVAPIAGDIAGTLVAPQLKGPQMGIRALNLLLRSGGAAAGAGVGAMAGQKIMGEDVDFDVAKRSAMLAGGGEAGMSLAGKPIAFAARKAGKPALDLMSDLTMAGAGLKSKMRDDLIAKTTARANQFVSDLAPDLVKKQNVDIDDLGLQVSAAMDESRAAYSVYKEPLEKHVQEGGEIFLDDTAQMLGEIADKIRESSDRRLNPFTVVNRVLKEFGYTPSKMHELQKLMQSNLSDPGPKQIEFILAKINDGWENLGPSQRAAREKLKENILNDLDKIVTEGGQTVSSLKKEADEAFKSVVRFKKIKQLFDNAIKEDRATGAKQLLPSKLAKNIYGAKKKIKDEMPEMWPKLKEEADFYVKVAPDFKKQQRNLAGGTVGRLFQLTGPVGGTIMGGPKGFLGAEGLGAASAYSLMSPKAQAFIRKMFKASKYTVGKPTLHLGAGMMGPDNGQAIQR